MRRPVLHVAPFLWSGAGNVITALCEAQHRRGPVVLVTTGASGELRDWPSYRRRLRAAGVRHRAIDTFHRDPPRLADAARALARLLAELRPGVIHAHAGVPTAVAADAREQAGLETRLIAQMYSWGTGRPGWMDAQDAAAFARADRVVCSADAYWDRLVALGVPRRRLTYLPWGLPLEQLAPRTWRPAAAGAPVLGFVGRLERRKGQHLLVQALAAVRRSAPNARLELVGPVAEPAYAREVATVARRLGVEGAVRHLGQVRDVAAALRRWDVFVSMSSDEGQGLAVLEAMAVGVPVAARAVAGIEDFLVDGRTGWRIDGASARTAAATVRRLLADPRAARRVVRGARRLVERRYDWRGTLDAFDRLYWR